MARNALKSNRGAQTFTMVSPLFIGVKRTIEDILTGRQTRSQAVDN